MTYRASEMEHATWDDLGAIAHALYMITQANVGEQFMAEMCEPLIVKIAALGMALVDDGKGKA